MLKNNLYPFAAVEEAERVVAAEHEVNGPLRLDISVEVHRSRAVEERRVAYLLVERCLVVETRGEAERPLFRLGGQEAHRQARREERLFVPVPRREAQAVSQVK